MFLEFQMYHITNVGDNPANVDFQIIKDRVLVPNVELVHVWQDNFG